MKRLICVILCFTMLLCLSACEKEQEKIAEPISFYYLQVQVPNQIHHGTINSVITPEVLEGRELRLDLTRLLEQYLAGPTTDSCRSPFPAGTSLVEWSMDGTTLCITLSNEIAILSGIDMTLACACLAKTCLELGQCGAVRIQAESLTLDGKVAITMNKSILVLLDDTIPAPEQND